MKNFYYEEEYEEEYDEMTADTVSNWDEESDYEDNFHDLQDLPPPVILKLPDESVPEQTQSPPEPQYTDEELKQIEAVKKLLSCINWESSTHETTTHKFRKANPTPDKIKQELKNSPRMSRYNKIGARPFVINRPRYRTNDQRNRGFEMIKGKMDLTRTQLCRSELPGSKMHCPHGVRCRYAHPSKGQALLIRDCPFGNSCRFVHKSGSLIVNKRGTKMCEWRHPCESDDLYKLRTGIISLPTGPMLKSIA